MHMIEEDNKSLHLHLHIVWQLLFLFLDCH